MTSSQTKYLSFVCKITTVLLLLTPFVIILINFIGWEVHSLEHMILKNGGLFLL